MVRTRKGHNMRSNAVGVGALLATCCCGLLQLDTGRLLQAGAECLFLSPWRSPAASSSGTADLVYGISFATAMLGGRVLMALTSAPPMATTAGWPLVWILSAM